MSDFDEFDAFEAAAAPNATPVPLSQRAMGARPATYLDELNPAQREAVERLDGPVLMLAGAGTGKTKALTARIAHLINTHRARPDEILAVTFTNKAAREMKDRVGNYLGNGGDSMRWMGTFHAICVKLLRRNAELVGLKSNFTILDMDDVKRLLKQLIEAEGIDRKRWPERELAGVIDAWKNRAWTPEKVPTSDASAFNGKGLELYKQYQRRLRELNACDFGDLLVHMVTIFQKHDDVLAQYHRWFKYVLVDEYQDTNVAQYLWLRLLAQGHKNICCVGDDDQSIYGWRGAEVGNILKFEKDFPGAHVVRLEQNYRSTPHILAAASAVIAGNSNRLGKTLWTEREDGEKVRLIGHWDGDEEARWIGEEAESIQRGTRSMASRSLEDMAILVRASHQMRAFEDRFLSIGLPYRVIGGPRFYERMEIRDAMAYFRVVTSPEDDLAFERIVNTPKRGVGDKALQNIQICARENSVPLLEATRILLRDGAIKGKAKTELSKLVESFERWSDMTRVGRVSQVVDDHDDDLFEDISEPDETVQVGHIALAEIILDESGYTSMWQKDKTPEAPGRLENLKELVKALENFDNLQGFLEHVSLIMENDSSESEEKLTIMTLHGAKGLEFPVVFLPGWEEGLFPSQRSMDESGQKGLEEERRLAYVGITRSEALCTISFAGNRRVYGQWQSQLPGRFIDELPEDHVEVLSAASLGTGGGRSSGFDDDFSDLGMSSMQKRAINADGWDTPGFKRMQARQAGGARTSVTPKRKRSNLMVDGDAQELFRPGDRIFQTKFGYGTVMESSRDTLDVEFDKAGSKKVKAGFVVAADRAGDVPF
ncbi:ATP-dependent helicase [Halocynthiibacter namhaensis]|uniref:ATP-dependent helicase n=1 Tax=Halocynthiibacter namhaensis TaxID=1290553 RepID=UPI00057963D8|nr:UvrD-helicase domain-containing protein [Halocynthiibacter namhaensis]